MVVDTRNIPGGLRTLPYTIRKGLFMKRQIIIIDQEKCNGCGLCAQGCPEGALKIIDGKARLVGEILCDGLGACIGQCPEGAIAFETREADAYDERKVIDNIIPQGENVLAAHLKHLKDHNQTEYLDTAMSYLKEKNITVAAPADAAQSAPESHKHHDHHKHDHDGHKHHGHSHDHGHAGCPGSRTMELKKAPSAASESSGDVSSQLTHWPIQLHLIQPTAQHFANSDLLVAADCTAFTLGAFHPKLLKGKTLTIACPKLDDGKESYIEKLVALIDGAKVNTVTVAIMEVPCCKGLASLVQTAAANATRKVPIKLIVVGIAGEIVKEEWL